MAKLGYEVEGRDQGIETLFINVDEFMKMKEFNLFNDIGVVPGEFFQYKNIRINHLYISDHKNELNLKSEIFKRLSKTLRVTIEMTKLLKRAPDYLNIFLLIDNESFWLLKFSDQIKFSKDLTVFSEKKQNLVLTLPKDFEKDLEINV